MLRICNSLPEDVVSADHLSLFIRRLERVKLNQFFDRHKLNAFMCSVFILVDLHY